MARKKSAPAPAAFTTIEVVVLPPIDTSRWTRAGLDAEIEAIRARYLEVLEG